MCGILFCRHQIDIVTYKCFVPEGRLGYIPLPVVVLWGRGVRSTCLLFNILPSKCEWGKRENKKVRSVLYKTDHPSIPKSCPLKIWMLVLPLSINH